MQVKELMTRDPALCTRETALSEVARAMVEHDCGAIPVVDDLGRKRLVGIVTDRDIVCRTLAREKDPMGLTAADAMSAPAIFARPDGSLEDCLDVMEESQVRRLPVTDAQGAVIGLVTQAQISRHASDEQTARLVRDVSRKTAAASAVGGR
jgi:CBS domain-containing protein